MDKKAGDKQHKHSPIKQCVLIAKAIQSDYENSSIFQEVNSLPAIDYTINWLIRNNIEEVFVFYTDKNVQIYFQKNKFSQIKVSPQFGKQGELQNLGDVLRDVQFRGLVSEDFLLVFGDMITNIDLNKLVARHYQGFGDGKNQLKSVMTIAMKNSVGKHLYVLNSNNGQILQVQKDEAEDFTLLTYRANPKKMNLEIRRDISLAEVYICTQESLKLFKQNFQFGSIHDFLHGTLTSQVSIDRISTYILERDQLSFRVSKAQHYYLCYMNFISRNLYPYTVENMKKINKHIFSPAVIFDYNKVTKKGCKIQKQAQLSNNIYIGENSSIGKNCQIIKSIICKNCTIKANSVLSNCIVTDGCTIAENSNYQYCLIAKVGQSIKVYSFKKSGSARLIQKDLFEQEQSEKQMDLTQEISQLMTEQIDDQLVKAFYDVRKHRNLLNEDILKIMLQIAAPAGENGVRGFVEKWGQSILKMHYEEQQQLMTSFYKACIKSEKYKKAFHVFLQYLYLKQIVAEDQILSWYKNQNQATVTLKLCEKFIISLQQEDQQQQDQQDQADT